MTNNMIDGPTRIAMWSGPRNISTAMMRSFGARTDCAVTDEPFYGAFLKTTGFRQPMADEIIASMDSNWQSVAENIRDQIPGGKAIWYQKHMPHHMVADLSIADFPNHRHAFLIRDPERVVASYAAKQVEVTIDDLGYRRQLDYVDQACQMTGEAAVIVDSNDILCNPEAYLRALCAALYIPWDRQMLQWETGRRETDGVWGKHWYNRVIETTGFGEPESALPKLSAKGQRVADQCRKYYDTLSSMRINIL